MKLPPASGGYPFTSIVRCSKVALAARLCDFYPILEAMVGFRFTGLCAFVALILGTLSTARGEDHWLSLKSDEVTIGINEDLTLAVYAHSDEDAVWTTDRAIVTVRRRNTDGEENSTRVELTDEIEREVESVDDGVIQGHRIRFTGIGEADVELSVILALDEQDRLLVEAHQTGGADDVVEITGLYRFAVAPQQNAYLVVPWGSGYMIRSDSTKPVSLAGFVGASYSLPLFGLVQGDHTLYQIIESWWDAYVRIDHAPGDKSRISLDWKASHGKLDYARRVLLVFKKGQNHVDMAKAYRKYLADRDQLMTLEERMRTTPRLKRFLAGVEYRSVTWEAQDHQQVLDNIVRFQKAGLPVTFFHPKWMATSGWMENSWQDYLKDKPREGGWSGAGKLIEEAHRLGCPVKLFVMPHVYYANGPDYDTAKLSGVGFPKISDQYAVEVVQKILDNLEDQGIDIDALYFDGHSAHHGHAEHRSAEGPVTRKQTFEAQVNCFRETRRRGIIPGAELARFWCVNDCDYFFFTDWSSDRLRDGEPIPLFPLVFNECYAAHFSGGGYYGEGKYDWYADRHPRLFELMYGAMPSHNWLPGGSRLIRPEDWDTDAMARRLNWLRRWHRYFQAVCFSEMVDHRFLSDNRLMHQVEYANGVIADFDLAQGRFRVQGAQGFTGDWEVPEVIEAPGGP